jgi:RNA polymerase-binding protein DksA
MDLKYYQHKLEELRKKALHVVAEANDQLDEALENDDAALKEKAQRRIKDCEFMFKKIDNAFARMQKNEYGMCVHCVADISEERLMKNPVAESCIDCAQEAA